MDDITVQRRGFCGAAACLAWTIAWGVISPAAAELHVEADFASYNEGELPGQHGWEQDLGREPADGPAPIVRDGILHIPGGQRQNNPDAIKPFSHGLSAGDRYYVSARLVVRDAPTHRAGSSYFLAVKAGRFANLRLHARETSANTYALGVRATGQDENETTFGRDMMYAEPVDVLLVWEHEGSGQSDRIQLYVDDFDAPYAEVVNAGSDPATFDGLLISQFGVSSGAAITTEVDLYRVASGTNRNGVSEYIQR